MERITKKTVIIPDVIPETDNLTLINEYLKDAQCMGLTTATIENYSSCLKIFSTIIEKSLIDIDIADLKKFKIRLEHKENRYHEKLNAKTISKYFSAIQSLYEFLELEGYIDKSPMPKFRKRYLKNYKRKIHPNASLRRKLISIEEMGMLINSAMDPRDKAVLTVLAKTGIRRKECCTIDIDDIDWVEQCIHLKPTPKRTNLDVYFDDECSRVLKRWMISRENRANKGTMALFLNERGGRLWRNAIYDIVVKHATKVGLHNPYSHKIQDRFTTHCTRHWYCTWLRRNGMPRPFIQELRGDSKREALDIYDHIDRKELRDSYLACIPQLGVD
jgi:integrase/recombinase XerD